MDDDLRALLTPSLLHLHYLAIWTEDVGSVRGGSKNSSKLKWSREAGAGGSQAVAVVGEGNHHQGEDDTHDGAEKTAIVDIDGRKAIPVSVRFRYFWEQWQGEDMD